MTAPLQAWYARPVFFVADIQRALRFYVDGLRFSKSWHEADGAGKVCQVNRAGCELILCEDATRSDRGRLFIELTAEGLRDFRAELATGSIRVTLGWWGYEVIELEDPDGNQLFFPVGG